MLGELGRAAFLKMLNPGGLDHNQRRGHLQSADTALNRAPLTPHYSIQPCPPHRSGAPQPSSCSSLGDPHHQQGSHEGGGTALPPAPLATLAPLPAPGTWTTFLANKARLSPRGGSQPSREGSHPCASPTDTGQLTSANINSDNKRHAGQAGPKRIQRTQPLQKRPPRGTAQAAGWGGPSGQAAASSPVVRTVRGTQSPGAGKQGTAQGWDSGAASQGDCSAQPPFRTSGPQDSKLTQVLLQPTLSTE